MLHVCLLLDGIPITTELRFYFEVTPVINKRAEKGPAPSRHPRPAGWIALPFFCLLSLFLPVSCADTCLTGGLSGFYYRGNYFAWVVKPSKVGFTTHRGSKSQVKWGFLPA